MKSKFIFILTNLLFLFFSCSDELDPLYFAVENGDRARLIVYLDQGVSPDQKKENLLGEWNLIHLAAINGHLDIIKILDKRGANLKAKVQNGVTALHFAAGGGYCKIIQYLLDQGVEVSPRTTKGALIDVVTGETPLNYAANKGHLDCVKLLVEQGANVKEENDDGETALHDAAKSGSLPTVRYLIEKGAEVNAQSKKGISDANTYWTALHYASYLGYIDIVQFLIEKGADTDLKDKNGKKAIDYAKNDFIKRIINKELKS